MDQLASLPQMTTQLQSFLIHWISPSAISAKSNRPDINTMFSTAKSPEYHALQPPATALHLPFLIIFALSIPLLLRLRTLILRDYASFISLGPGGTPQTPAGYLHVTSLRLLVARRDVCAAPRATARNSRPVGPYFRIPKALPRRKHGRPCVAGIAPHRQLEQRGTPEDVRRLSEAMREVATRNPGRVTVGRSCFEKHSLALFLVPEAGPDTSTLGPVSAGSASTLSGGRREGEADLELGTAGTTTGPTTAIHTTSASGAVAVTTVAVAAHEAATATATTNGVPWNRTCGAPPEIAHLHGSEGSLHVTLDAADVAKVLERGWGERHPLAGRWLRSGFTMVYAPRSEDEVAAVMEIVRAGAWWVGELRLN